MNGNYAEICRVGNLEAYFQQLPLVHFFSNFHSIVVKNSNSYLAKNDKKYILRQIFKKKKKKKKKITLLQKLHRSHQYLAINLILV